MNTTAHTLISGSIAIGLAVFTALSAIFVGLAASPTIAGVSLLAMLGLVEITILSYSTPYSVLNGPRRTSRPAASQNVMVAFPTVSAQRKVA